MKINKKQDVVFFESMLVFGLLIFGFTNFQQSQPLYSTVSEVGFTALTPTCLDRSDIPDSEYHWTYFPKSSSELETNVFYGYLAGQLITNGVVDASDCPLNGIWPSGYANACGLSKTQDIVFELQNVYDDEILDAGYEIGVPPVMLKQLIRYESQFWPVRFGTYHYGLSHLTYIGASTALQWNPVLYEQMCLLKYNGPCPVSYVNYSPATDYVLSGQLLSLLDASCADCEYKIDVEKGENSIEYIAQSLMGYCRQTSQIVYNITQNMSNYTVDYPTIWKLTLMNHNAGPICVYDAFEKAYEYTQGPVSWDHIAQNVEGAICLRGLNYANQITEKFYNFSPEDN